MGFSAFEFHVKQVLKTENGFVKKLLLPVLSPLLDPRSDDCLRVVCPRYGNDQEGEKQGDASDDASGDYQNDCHASSSSFLPQTEQ